MPSLSSATYYQYYPFGTTDIITNYAIFSIFLSILFKILMISALWMLGNYGLHELIHHSNIYITHHLYLIEHLYWFLIPHSIFLYILLTMLFEPLSLHKHCRYYIIITCIWSFCIIFTLNAIVFINSENDSNHTFNKPICNYDISFCSISFEQFTLYSISFFLSTVLSTIVLYIIEINSKSCVSILLQSIFCFKYRFCKLICNKQYRLKQTRKSDLHSTLLSSEIMSEMNVKDEKEFHVMFANTPNHRNDTEAIANTPKIPYINCCVRVYRNYSLCYLNLYSLHKFLLLLVLFNISLFICYIVIIWMHKMGNERIAQDNYVIFMVIWLFMCYTMKLWMKLIGRHIDSVRLDIKLKYCTDGNIRKQIYNLTKRITGIPRQITGITYTFTNNTDVSMSSICSDDEFTFDIAFEVAMEILIQIIYYSFYRDFTFIFCTPKWKQFIIYKAVDLWIICMLYWIRMLPFYYKYTLNICNSNDAALDPDDDTPHLQIMMSPEASSVLKEVDNTPKVSVTQMSVTPLAPMDAMTPMTSIDESKSMKMMNGDDMRQISAMYDEDDADVMHINAVDNIYQYYQRGYDDINPKKSMTDTEINSMILDAFYNWRNRVCIDCVLQFIAMIVTAFVSYGTLMIYYLTENDEYAIDTKQWRTATYYFLISIGSELLLYILLFGFVFIGSSFNIFQPFTRLYAKSTHVHHYVLLFVICSVWLY